MFFLFFRLGVCGVSAIAQQSYALRVTIRPSSNHAALLIRPILFRFLQSEGVKKLVVDLLTAYAESTESQIDDQVVSFVVSFHVPGDKS